MDLNDAADMRDEAEQAFNDARKTRGKRDLLYVAVMACVIVMLTGAVCGRKDIIIASAVIAVTLSCAGSLACYRMKKSLHTYHIKEQPLIQKQPSKSEGCFCIYARKA